MYLVIYRPSLGIGVVSRTTTRTSQLSSGQPSRKARHSHLSSTSPMHSTATLWERLMEIHSTAILAHRDSPSLEVRVRTTDPETFKSRRVLNSKDLLCFDHSSC